MAVFRINYTADGKRNTIIMEARNESAARKKCKGYLKQMGVEEVTINSIREIV